MKQGKHRYRTYVPWALLFVLLITGTYLAGIRHGQSVADETAVLQAREEIREEVVQAFSQISTPSVTAPTLEPEPVNHGFTTYSNDVCGFSFVYPDYLKADLIDQNNAVIKNMATEQDEIRITCASSSAELLPEEISKEVDRVFFADESFPVYPNPEGPGKNSVSFIINNVRTNNYTRIQVPDYLFPLISSSIRPITP